MKKLAFLLAVIAGGAVFPLCAQPVRPPIVGKVESVQWPAWVMRGGVRASVKAGWALYANDTLYTGPEGRLSLTLTGDAPMKVSGNAELAFTNLTRDSAVGAPVFDIRAGSFQLQAPIVQRADQPGVIFTMGGKATANVRGGQVIARENALVQVDGLTVVTSTDKSTVTANAPQTIVSITPAGKALAPIPVPPERLAQWVSEAQPVASKPALKANGTWDVSLNSGYNLKELEAMACKINKRGYPTEIYPVREPGKQVWYRVVVRRFASKNEAVQFLGTARELGSKEPWVLLPQS